MNKKQIEDLSVNAVRKSISLTDYLSPYINDNDKEPSWDGTVIIHSDKNCTKNDIKRVLVQVKGKKCDDFSKSEISFPAETSDLRNYLNNGGIIYFVVYLKKDGTEKIYYSTLTPVKLKKYLKNIGTQKSKNINLKEFPEDRNKKMNIFVNFFENCKKQVSFVDIGFISLDKLNQEGVKEITMSLTWYDCKDNRTDIREMFFENEIYIYAKIEGSKALHPVDTIISSISFPETVQELISIDGKTYYSSYSRIHSKDKVELKIGDSLRKKIDYGLSNANYGIVIISPSFVKKNWTEYELNGIVAREMNGHKVILPIWHKISKDEVLKFSPTLADKLALNTSIHTIDDIVQNLKNL